MRDNVLQSSALMKIATFNINNINRRLPHLLAWLDAARPDVVCLQELKAADSQFPEAAIAERGYGAIWQGERTWNGVAILRRGGKPVLTRRACQAISRTFRPAISRPRSAGC
jgi:exodeoxyribonuclease III